MTIIIDIHLKFSGQKGENNISRNKMFEYIRWEERGRNNHEIFSQNKMLSVFNYNFHYFYTFSLTITTTAG